MKTAEEVAEEILLMSLDQTKIEWNDHGKTKLKLIAQALTAYAEERVKEVEYKWRNTQWNQALEEAAKIIDGQNGLDGSVCANMIRALKEKP